MGLRLWGKNHDTRCGDSARLDHDDLAGAPRLFDEHQGNDGGLAGAWLGDQNRSGPLDERGDERTESTLDREVGGSHPRI